MTNRDVSLELHLDNILKSLLESETIPINLTIREVEYIKYFLQDDNMIYSKIIDTINSIISEGTINSCKIPQMIVIFHEVFTSHNLENNIKNISVINVIRFICNSIFDSKNIPVMESEIIIIKSVVDSSLKLLSINSNINSNNSNNLSIKEIEKKEKEKREQNCDICYIYKYWSYFFPKK